MNAAVSFLDDKKWPRAAGQNGSWPSLTSPISPLGPVEPAVPAFQGAERRAEPRRPVQIAGLVEVEGRDQDCLVLDVSPGGAMIQLERAAAVGQTVKLRLTENGEFAGTVRWRGDRRMGVQFDHFGGLTPA